MQTGMNLWQQDGVGPNSAHIMWTNPIEFGGVVPGNSTGGTSPGGTYYSGGSYQGRYRQRDNNERAPHRRATITGYTGTGGGDSMRRPSHRNNYGGLTRSARLPSFGYLFDFEDENQHGVLPDGLLLHRTLPDHRVH